MGCRVPPEWILSRSRDATLGSACQRPCIYHKHVLGLGGQCVCVRSAVYKENAMRCKVARLVRLVRTWELYGATCESGRFTPVSAAWLYDTLPYCPSLRAIALVSALINTLKRIREDDSSSSLKTPCYLWVHYTPVSTGRCRHVLCFCNERFSEHEYTLPSCFDWRITNGHVVTLPPSLWETCSGEHGGRHLVINTPELGAIVIHLICTGVDELKSPNDA